MSNMNDGETGVGEEGDLCFINVETGRRRRLLASKYGWGWRRSRARRGGGVGDLSFVSVKMGGGDELSASKYGWGWRRAGARWEMRGEGRMVGS
jgi:hypothetical protein